MRTGVLGGTFDPPHFGHLRMARLAQSQLGLDRVLFVPCHAQPLKGAPPAASPFHRAAMVALALEHKAGWLLEVQELERGGISYTADTLDALASKYPEDRFFLILGEDSLQTFPQWRRHRDILRLAELAVVPRGLPGGPPEDRSGDCAHRLQGRHLPVSSTLVREILRRGEAALGLVPRAVATYIHRQGLYGPARRRAVRRDD